MKRISKAIEAAVARLDAPTLAEMQSRAGRAESSLEDQIFYALKERFHPFNCRIHRCNICSTRESNNQNQAIVGMMMSGGGCRRV